MYLNPTVQLHTAYELIEHLLELNKPRKMKKGAVSAALDIATLPKDGGATIQLLSR